MQICSGIQFDCQSLHTSKARNISGLNNALKDFRIQCDLRADWAFELQERARFKAVYQRSKIH